MNSLFPETVSYGIVAAFALFLLGGGIRDIRRLKRPPRAATILLILTTSLAISAITVFFSAYLRLANAGVLTPKHGLYLRIGIESGIVGALVSVYRWRFR